MSDRSPEGCFNHKLFDSLWQLLSIPGKRTITLRNERRGQTDRKKGLFVLLENGKFGETDQDPAFVLTKQKWLQMLQK